MPPAAGLGAGQLFRQQKSTGCCLLAAGSGCGEGGVDGIAGGLAPRVGVRVAVPADFAGVGVAEPPLDVMVGTAGSPSQEILWRVAAGWDRSRPSVIVPSPIACGCPFWSRSVDG